MPGTPLGGAWAAAAEVAYKIAPDPGYEADQGPTLWKESTSRGRLNNPATFYRFNAGKVPPIAVAAEAEVRGMQTPLVREGGPIGPGVSTPTDSPTNRWSLRG